MEANGSGTIVNAEQIERKIVDIRRHLHQYPELSHEEFETTAYIRKLLEDAGIRIAAQYTLKTGLIAEVGGLQGGPSLHYGPISTRFRYRRIRGCPLLPGFRGRCMRAVTISIRLSF